jgi:hypothetical protein
MAVLFKVYLFLLDRVVVPFTSELELRAGKKGAEKKNRWRAEEGVVVSRHVTIRLVSTLPSGELLHKLIKMSRAQSPPKHQR